MSLADEIKKLEELHRSGALTNEEFVKAKVAIIEATAGDTTTGNFAAQLGEIRHQAELSRIDREWEIEKEQYKITGGYGARYLPTKGMGFAFIGFGGGSGAFLIVMTFLLFEEMRGEHGPPLGLMAFIVLVGIVVTAGAIWYGIHVIRKSEAYSKGLAAYRARRAALKPRELR
jgi:hypothetical protein